MVLGRRVWRGVVAAALLAALAGCLTPQRISAAGDVHALLIAIRDDDKAAFDARVDRPALEKQLESRILAATQSPGASKATQAIGAVLAGPLAQFAGETFIRPPVFRAVAEYYGYKADTPIPNQLEIAGALRPLDQDHVCAAKGHGGPCVLTFANEDGVWRLVSFDGDINLLKLK